MKHFFQKERPAHAESANTNLTDIAIGVERTLGRLIQLANIVDADFTVYAIAVHIARFAECRDRAHGDGRGHAITAHAFFSNSAIDVANTSAEFALAADAAIARRTIAGRHALGLKRDHLFYAVRGMKEIRAKSADAKLFTGTIRIGGTTGCRIDLTKSGFANFSSRTVGVLSARQSGLRLHRHRATADAHSTDAPVTGAAIVIALTRLSMRK